MVSSMSAEEKLRAVQLWNVLSEKLQEIVNNSAADINALAFQEQPPPAHPPDFFFYPPAAKPAQPHQQELPAPSNNNAYHQPQQEDNNSPAQEPLSKSPIRESSLETDNSLASFSDIQCADDESIHMDGVCPLTLPLNVEERNEEPDPSAESVTEVDKEKSSSKQFPCLECGVAFKTKAHLLEHSRKHTGLFF